MPPESLTMSNSRFADSRTISILEAAHAKHKAEGKTGPTLEEKQITLLAVTRMFKMDNAPEHAILAVARLARILAPELAQPENLTRLKTLIDLFNADILDAANGKLGKE